MRIQLNLFIEVNASEVLAAATLDDGRMLFCCAWFSMAFGVVKAYERIGAIQLNVFSVPLSCSCGNKA